MTATEHQLSNGKGIIYLLSNLQNVWLKTDLAFFVVEVSTFSTQCSAGLRLGPVYKISGQLHLALIFLLMHF